MSVHRKIADRFDIPKFLHHKITDFWGLPIFEGLNTCTRIMFVPSNSRYAIVIVPHPDPDPIYASYSEEEIEIKTCFCPLLHNRNYDQYLILEAGYNRNADTIAVANCYSHTLNKDRHD